MNPEQLGSADGQVNSSVMSASIMTNNIKVGILAFAGGVTFGLLTVYVLIYNGILVGALAGLFFHHGKSYEFWAYIVPHGMIELTAIFIAGGAGLLMGYKLFVPGQVFQRLSIKDTGETFRPTITRNNSFICDCWIDRRFHHPSRDSLGSKIYRCIHNRDWLNSLYINW